MKRKQVTHNFGELTVRTSAVSYGGDNTFDVYRGLIFRGIILRVKAGFSAKDGQSYLSKVYPTMEAAAIAQDK